MQLATMTWDLSVTTTLFRLDDIYLQRPIGNGWTGKVVVDSRAFAVPRTTIGLLLTFCPCFTYLFCLPVAPRLDAYSHSLKWLALTTLNENNYSAVFGFSFGYLRTKSMWLSGCKVSRYFCFFLMLFFTLCFFFLFPFMTFPFSYNFLKTLVKALLILYSRTFIYFLFLLSPTIYSKDRNLGFNYRFICFFLHCS